MDAPKLSDERLRRLPRPAALALAARCALRVRPAFSSASAADEQTLFFENTATICGLAALQAAAEPETRHTVGQLAADSLLPAQRGGVGEHAKQCLMAAARAAGLPSDADVWAPPSLPSVLAAYAEVGEFYGLADVFRQALEEDVATAGAFITLEYFARPLFAPHSGIPELWRPVFDGWAEFAGRMHASHDIDLYHRMSRGWAFERKTIDERIDQWKQSYEERRQSALLKDGLQNLKTSRDVTEPPPEEATSPPDVWMVADRPLTGDDAEKGDRFDFKHYATAIATILDHDDTTTPFTMAINAPWGAGKTTLANMIKEELRKRCDAENEAPHIICDFNAWMHDDAPNVATAFVSQVSRTANAHRFWPVRLLRPLPWAVLEPGVRRRRRFSGALLVIVMTLFASWWVGGHLQHVKAMKDRGTQTLDAATLPDDTDRFLHRVESHVVVLGAFLTALGGLITVLVRVVTSTGIGSFVQSPDKAAEAGAIPTARDHLGRLIKQATWRGNRFVVFVDDIERCTPPRSIDVLDVISQLMDHPGVLVVLLGDMSAVAAAAQLKYKDLAEIYVPSSGVTLTGADRGKEAFGRLYLQKIVQFQFDLPIPPKTQIRRYMEELAVSPQSEGTHVGATT